MPRSSKYDPVTGSLRQPLILLVIAIPIFFGTLANTIWSFPNKTPIFQNSGFALAVAGGVLSIWMNYQPSLLAKSLLFICMGIMFLLISIRSFGDMFPSHTLFWGFLILTSFILAFIAPLLNKANTAKVRERILQLKSSVGRGLSIALSFLAPGIGLIGAIFRLVSSRYHLVTAHAVFFSLLSWLLGIGLPFSTTPPLYRRDESLD